MAMLEADALTHYEPWALGSGSKHGTRDAIRFDQRKLRRISASKLNSRGSKLYATTDGPGYMLVYKHINQTSTFLICPLQYRVSDLDILH
jgi:hypothetical protein